MHYLSTFLPLLILPFAIAEAPAHPENTLHGTPCCDADLQKCLTDDKKHPSWGCIQVYNDAKVKGPQCVDQSIFCDKACGQMYRFAYQKDKYVSFVSKRERSATTTIKKSKSAVLADVVAQFLSVLDPPTIDVASAAKMTPAIPGRTTAKKKKEEEKEAAETEEVAIASENRSSANSSIGDGMADKTK